MTKKSQKLDVSKVLNLGLGVIKKPELAANQTHLERYLRNFLKIYKMGVDTIDMKILFYQDLHDGKPETLKIPETELPGSPTLRQTIKEKIRELEQKRDEWIKVAEGLPDRLPFLVNDDPDFKKILHMDDAWSAKNGCLVLGMCICEYSRHRPYKSTCLSPPDKDFSILR